jgi:hypothetical protein
VLNFLFIFCRFHSIIGPGNTVSVIGEFNDQGKCIVDHDNNLVIVHPELLISGTRVSAILCVLIKFVPCSDKYINPYIRTTYYNKSAIINSKSLLQWKHMFKFFLSAIW